jgi:hypothetical protein
MEAETHGEITEMSKRREFDRGYCLAVRHVIEQLAFEIASGTAIERLEQELRLFYAEELEKEDEANQ